MNNIELQQGDCLDLLKVISDNSVDLVLTDPPYFCSDKTRSDWDKEFSLSNFWKEAERILKPNGSILIFGNEPFSSFVRTSNIRLYKYDIKWIKNRATGFANANYRPMNKYEDIMVFSFANASSGGRKNPMIYRPQGLVEVNKTKKNSAKRHGKIMDRTKNTGSNNSLLMEGSTYTQRFTNYPSNVVEFKCEKSDFHPTQKPVLLLEYLIKTYTTEEATVLDCFMGSGSTGVACVNTGRKFIGIELDEGYFQVAKQRIENCK